MPEHVQPGTGKARVWLSHERLGYNYRMDELSAALGVAQMSRIEEIIAKRERVAAMYAERLAKVPGVRLPYVAPEVTRMSWFVYVIRVGVDEPTPERQSAVRDHVMRRFQEAGIGCRPYFTPIHLQPFYRAEFEFKEGDFPVTELAGRTSIAIPSHNHPTRPHRRGERLRRRRPRAGAGGGAVVGARPLVTLPSPLGFPDSQAIPTGLSLRGVGPRTEAPRRPALDRARAREGGRAGGLARAWRGVGEAASWGWARGGRGREGRSVGWGTDEGWVRSWARGLRAGRASPASRLENGLLLLARLRRFLLLALLLCRHVPYEIFDGASCLRRQPDRRPEPGFPEDFLHFRLREVTGKAPGTDLEDSRELRYHIVWQSRRANLMSYLE